MFRVPLAWMNLINKPWHLLITLGGITSAVILMFIEFGIENAMYDNQLTVVQALDTDLLVFAKSRYSISVDQRFPYNRLARIRAVNGVEDVLPFYIESRRIQIRNPQTRRRYLIRVLAFDLRDDVFKKEYLDLNQELIANLDTALIDKRSKQQVGEFLPGIETEVGNRKFTISGHFSLGTDFVNDGNLIMSKRSYQKLLNSPSDLPAIGLIRLRPGVVPEKIITGIRNVIPEDIAVLTREEAIAREKDYWKKNTFIGFVFGVGAFLGFAVGVTICSQILYAGVMDYLPQYATLKAMGYSNAYLVGTVLNQAFSLAVLGFLPGLFVSVALYQLLAEWTGMNMQLTFLRVLLILSLTLGMCAFSAVLAIRRIIYADPAEVFK
jgi:putative ABC transport system permease protein